MSKKTGAQILVECLALHAVERVSSVAGESYLAVLDVLLDHQEISVITCRHEGGAAFMAESWGKLTGKPGICFVTRGPGACNASIGVHTAMQDSTPMILFMGQVRREERGREAFQEIDVREVFGGLAKWATEIDDPRRIPEIVSRAFKTALSGRPGPVVIGLPEDMLTESAEARIEKPFAPVQAAISAGAITEIRSLLQKAQRPLIIAGGSGWTDASCDNLMSFAKTCHIPVAASFRRHDIFSHKNACYAGELGTGTNPRLTEKVKESDLLLVIGARLNEIATQGYTLIDAPYPRQTLIHIHAGEAELGRVYVPALALQADVNGAAEALAGGVRVDGRHWAPWRDELRQIYQDWTAIDAAKLHRWNGADMTAIYAFLRNALPEDAIVTTDAGNFSGWAQRYLSYGRPGRLLAPTSGAMGYAVPSAVGASIAAPDKVVLGICGDGGFMMTGQELATALHHNAKPIIMLCNNNMYGTIRMHQERHYPGRVSATALTNPDFVAFGKSFGGALALRVESADDFPAAWKRGLAADGPVLLEIRMDPRQISTAAKP